MEDYLSEREQWEWLKAQVRDNAPWVALAVVLAVGGVYGWRFWQSHLDTGRLEASAKYRQMTEALENSDRSTALVRLGELEREYPGSPYTDQAKLLAARLYVQGNELDHAADELSAVAEHSKDHDLALIARLRLARVQIAQNKPDLAMSTLNGVDPGAFASRYHEARGDAYYAKGDKANALKEYRGAQSGNDPLLGLKISELTAQAAPAAAPVTAPAAAGAGK